MYNACKVALLAPLLLAGCAAGVVRTHQEAPARLGGRWTVAPIVNHSDAPQAGERIEAILAPVLRARGVSRLEPYPTAKADEPRAPGTDRRRRDDVVSWARAQQLQYVVLGSVEEWRYKGSIDAEPAVGLTLELLDVGSGRVVWSGSGTRSGAGDDTTSGVALRLVDTLVRGMEVGP